jgi:thiamine transport system ATP-binding protein
MLTLEGLDLRQYDFALHADWQVATGARVALIGPSGAGKSTLLLAIAGFLAPARGRILWQGQDLGPLAPGARPVTMLFQDQNLFPHLTVAQNLGLGLSPALRLGAGDWARVEAAMVRVGLAGLGGRKPGALSGGQQARAALARALLRARPLVLFDEPFAALGPGLRAEMLALVEELAAESGATVLIVSHDPHEIARFAPLASVVADGVAASPMPTAALLADPPPALRAYLGG